MIRLAALMAVAAMLALPRPVFAAEHTYAYQWATSTYVSGIDGYIRVSGTNMVDGNSNFHLSMFNLCSSYYCDEGFVQVGQFQGTVGRGTCPGTTCVRSVTYVHGYWENELPCDLYYIDDTGDEHLDPNVAYYISYVGSGVSSCGSLQAKYAFRSDSYTNPPDGYGYTSSSTGWPEAATELKQEPGDGEPLGQDRFGLNDNNQVQSGYGISVLKSGSWKAWNSANVPGSESIEFAPPYYYGVNAFTSFRTDDQ